MKKLILVLFLCSVVQASPQTSVAPWVGAPFSAFSDQATSQYAFGFDVEFPLSHISDNLAVVLGYSHSGIQMPGQLLLSPYYFGYGQGYGYSSTTNLLNYNQNNLGVTGRYYLAADGFRPFVGAGLTYSHASLDYDKSVVDLYRGYGIGGLENSWNLNMLLGELQAGFVYPLVPNLGVEMKGTYTHVLSSTTNGTYLTTLYSGYPIEDLSRRKYSQIFGSADVFTLIAGFRVSF